jgi:hypothetical protein
VNTYREQDTSCGFATICKCKFTIERGLDVFHVSVHQISFIRQSTLLLSAPSSTGIIFYNTYCFPIHLLLIVATSSSSTRPTRFKYNFNSPNVSTEHKRETQSLPIDNNRSPSAKKEKKTIFPSTSSTFHKVTCFITIIHFLFFLFYVYLFLLNKHRV